MPSRFHTSVLAHLDLPATPDPEALRILDARERAIGATLPSAFVEWFGMRNGVDLLRRYSRSDQPIALASIGDVERVRFAIDDRMWPNEPVLPFMVENQGVCVWGLRLDAGDDPPVVVAVDPEYRWRPHAETFSSFIACQVHDATEVLGDGLLLLHAQDVPLASEDLAYVRARLREGRQTQGWPGDHQYRFALGDARVLVWDDANVQADWSIASRSISGLEEAARALWKCGALSSSLWSNDPEATALLSRLRAGDQE